MSIMGSSAMSRSVEIGVVGGGASAVCLLDALAQTHTPPGGITVFEPSPHLWRGRPYQPDVETVRVNIAPDGMSVRFGDSGHFPRWLADRDAATGSGPDFVDPLNRMRFVPRALYGQYLEDAAQAALAQLRERGWRIDIVREAVSAATPDDGQVALRTRSGRQAVVDYTVLCVGRGQPGDPYALTGTEGFIADPYPLSRTLTDIGPDDTVGVIGSGLTGIDVVLSLAGGGHRGRILLLSRSGVLPLVRQSPLPYTLQHFTAERFRGAAARGEMLTVDELVGVMRTEFSAAGEDFDSVTEEIAALTEEDPVRRLRRHLAEVHSPRRGLRILQHAVPATGPDIWPLLPEHEKTELLRTHYRSVMSLCCPMPPTAAARVLDLIDAGQLEIVSGIRHIEPSGGGAFTLHTDEEQPAYRADRLVNAVSPSSGSLPLKAENLIASLTAAGLAQRHPRGGVTVDRPTSRLVVDGTADPRLYALGDLASGSLFFTFGLPSIVDRAYDIADAIHADVRGRTSSLCGADVLQNT
ncbi:Uncharacterized NAD(P)/FAD-binding protein YdhS [Streptomyces sp. 2112.3]|nr:Uncharacterized NAD(P)/FAD-binding protein YdhS [Streptomyces sp. 2112.3]